MAPHGGYNLAVWLQRAGYYTGMIGKYLNEYRIDSPVPRGWSEWRAAPAPVRPMPGVTPRPLTDARRGRTYQWRKSVPKFPLGVGLYLQKQHLGVGDKRIGPGVRSGPRESRS